MSFQWPIRFCLVEKEDPGGNPANPNNKASRPSPQAGNQGNDLWVHELKRLLKNMQEQVTHHWILKKGQTAKEEVREEDLLSYETVNEMLISKRSCQERDKFLMTKSTGRWDDRTSLWWACHAATISPSENTMRLVKLLIGNISNSNCTQFIETVGYYLDKYSADVCRLLLDKYDGDIIKLSTSSPGLVNREVHNVILDTIDSRYENSQEAIIRYATTDYAQPGELLVHHLTGWRSETKLCEMLKRVSLRSRRHILTYKDTQHGVTPLYLSRYTHREMAEKMLPGDNYVVREYISESLIRMFLLFCNEYSITSGVSLISYTIDRAENAITMTPSTNINHYHHHSFIETKSSSKSNVTFMFSTKYVDDEKSMESLNFQSMMQDLRLCDIHEYRVVLVQLVIRSKPYERPDHTVMEEKMEMIGLPKNVLHWFMLTCANLKILVRDIINSSNGLYSISQQLALIRHVLHRHHSVIYVSSLQPSSLSEAISSSVPVHSTVVCCEEPYSSLTSQTCNVGSAVILYITVHMETVNHDLVDISSLPHMKMSTKNDSVPKVIFIQILVKNKPAHQPRAKDLEKKVKYFNQPVDHCWLFTYTSQDLRQMVSSYLASDNSTVIQQKLSLLRQELNSEPEVIYVSALYSTLGRRLTLSDEPIDYKPGPVSLKPKADGSALLICIEKGRQCNRGGSCNGGWEAELNDAKTVLKDLIGLEVDCESDLGSSGIMAKVGSFAREHKDDKLSVLVIMCHGDGKDQIVTADGLNLSVHKLVNAFSQHSSYQKVVILQYCRGLIYDNRLKDTFEDEYVTQLANLAPGCLDAKITKSSRRQRIAPPDNVYLVYSTLSDSSSERGLMFRRMKSTILDMQCDPTEIQHCKYLELEKAHDYGGKDLKSNAKAIRLTNVNIIELMVDVAGGVREDSKLHQHMETVDRLLEPLCLTLRFSL